MDEGTAQRFALATYREIDGEHVALVLDQGMVEINQAIDHYRRVCDPEVADYAGLGSMTGGAGEVGLPPGLCSSWWWVFSPALAMTPVFWPPTRPTCWRRSPRPGR